MKTDAEIFDEYDEQEQARLNAGTIISIYNGVDNSSIYARGTVDLLKDAPHVVEYAAIKYAKKMKEESHYFAKYYDFLAKFAKQNKEGYTAEEITRRTWDEEQNFDKLVSLESLAQKKESQLNKEAKELLDDINAFREKEREWRSRR